MQQNHSIKTPLQTLIIGSGRLASAIVKQMQTDPHFTNPQILKRGQSIHLKPGIDCIIDASIAGVINHHLPSIASLNIPLVIATTGQSKAQLQEITNASKSIPILLCENFSQGIYQLTKILKEFDSLKHNITIQEIHHTKKKDSPSGTAKLLRRTLDESIPIKSLRQGQEIGTHTITIQMQDETLSFTHKAKCSSLFAKGALKACLFLLNKRQGLYTSPYE